MEKNKIIKQSANESLWELRKGNTRVQQYTKALQKIDYAVEATAMDPTWRFANDFCFKGYVFPNNQMKLYVLSVTAPAGRKPGNASFETQFRA